ncbi:MAG: hypothetical protein QNJ65_15560 [Xenococcaceae cyanobacterium MO_234.B1]|nr:hypothetical protein [Xenococcaceae cyanobacterium MO_234.B1]
MASIQILEISPVETPMKDLSYDVAGNVTGAGFLEDVSMLIDKVLDFATMVTELCASGALPPEICDRIY